MEENNDSSKSTTLTLLHSWAKLKSKAKQGDIAVVRRSNYHYFSNFSIASL